MRRAAALAVLLAAAACGDDREQQQALPANQAAQAQAQAQPAQPEIHSPVLLRYKPVDRGGPEGSMMALPQGVLDFTGPCVRLQGASGELRTVVAPAGSRLGRDFAGLYWGVGKERLRHGSSVIGGGGEMPRLPADDVLDGPVPEACRAGPAIEFALERRTDPPVPSQSNSGAVGVAKAGS